MTKDIYVLQLNATLGRVFPMSFTHHGGVPSSRREQSAMLLLEPSGTGYRSTYAGKNYQLDPQERRLHMATVSVSLRMGRVHDVLSGGLSHSTR